MTTDIKHNIENHWRDKIKQKGFDESKPDKKFVVVPMFPYPSGFLHLGHVRVYTISDAIANFFRLKGKNVINSVFNIDHLHTNDCEILYEMTRKSNVSGFTSNWMGCIWFAS